MGAPAFNAVATALQVRSGEIAIGTVPPERRGAVLKALENDAELGLAQQLARTGPTAANRFRPLRPRWRVR